MKVLALVAEGPGLGPGLDNEVMGLGEKLAVVRGIGIVRELLAARTAYPSRDQPAAGNHVNHGQLLRQPQRISQRQWIAQQDDFHLFGDAREDRRLHVHHAAHA